MKEAIIICLLTIISQTSENQSIKEKFENAPPDEIFRTFCSTCHGEDGTGNPNWKELGLDTAPPNFKDKKFSSKEPLIDWIRVIRDGGKKHGFSNFMPAFGGTFSEEKIKEIAQYLKSLGYDEKYPPGELNFLRTHNTKKAFPEDELIYIGEIKKLKVLLTKTIYFAQRIGAKTQYEIKGKLNNENSNLSGEIELGGKYTILFDRKNLYIISGGLEAGIPIKSEESISITPYLAGGKSLGERLSFQTSAQASYLLKESKIVSSISSALNFITTLNSKRGIFPSLEGTANFDGKNVLLSFIPQAYISLSKRGHIALNLGYQINQKSFPKIKFFLLWEFTEGRLVNKIFRKTYIPIYKKPIFYKND
jgi:cytochrome c553